MPYKKRIAIIGAGHNSLVCACYLAKAGHDVTVYERRSRVGGAVNTEELWPGYQVDASYSRSEYTGCYNPNVNRVSSKSD